MPTNHTWQNARLTCSKPLNRETRPDRFQLARGLRKKGATIFFLATRECFYGRQLATVLPLPIVSFLASCHSYSGVYLDVHLFGVKTRSVWLPLLGERRARLQPLLVWSRNSQLLTHSTSV